MSDKIRVLCVEDSSDDAELIRYQLVRSNIDVDFRQVDTKPDYLSALADFVPDIVLCDHALPSFNSLEALTILKHDKHPVPFILVTGAMTEQVAIELINEGADDFILKDRLVRLPYAVMNSVEKFRFEQERKGLIEEVRKNQILAKEALELEKQRFSALFEHAPSYIGVLRGRDYVFEMANPRIQQVTGRTFVGRKLKDVFPESVNEGIVEMLDSVYHSGRQFSAKEWLLRLDLDGSGKLKEYYVDFVCTPYKDSSGDNDAIFFFVNNVTEQVELRKRIEEREQNYKTLFDLSPVPKVLVEHGTLKILKVNQAAARQYGYTEAELLQMSFLRMFHSDSRHSFFEFTQQLKSANSTFRLAAIQVKKAGQKIFTEVNAVDFEFNGKKCILVTSNDVTEQTKLQNDLAEVKLTAQKRITRAQIKGQEKERQLVGTELHDNVNQQLCTVQLYLEIAQKQKQMQPELVIKSSQIVKSAINDIRTLCKSLVPPALKQVGLSSSLRELVDSFAPANKFVIHHDFKEEIDRLDEEMQLSVFRIVQEQLSNILKYAEARNVWIDIGITNRQLVVILKDDGKGFKLKSKKGGMGLLNIKNRVELFNGTVKIISSPGKGCVLHAKIPLEHHRPAGTSHIRIMMAEDDVTDQELFDEALHDVDGSYSLRHLSRSQDLLDLLQTLPNDEMPSLIVIDNNMPDIDGTTVLSKLKMNSRLESIPIVVFSSGFTKRQEDQLLAAGATAVIKKGATFEDLRHNVRDMISYCQCQPATF
jgi:PAS domain S-box-containing protein